MTLGTVLVIIALVLVIVSLFVPTHAHRLLGVAVGLVIVGLLVGVAALAL